MKEGFSIYTDCSQTPSPCMEILQGDDPTQSILSGNSVAIALVERTPFGHFPESAALDHRAPDLFCFAVPALFRGYYPGYSSSDMADHSIPDENRAPKPGNMYLSWLLLKGHTRNNNGRVRLNSSDPFATPDINFKYFEEGDGQWENDLDAVVHGIRLIRELMNREPFAKHVVGEVFESAGKESDEELRQFVRDTTWGHHASCTCKIGKKDDSKAVLDGQFRVHGVKNLRVVDVSVFPEIPGFFYCLTYPHDGRESCRGHN